MVNQVTIISWTREEDETLRELYPTADNGVLVKTFKRSLEAIRGRAHRLKIRRSGLLVSQTLKARAKTRWANRNAE